MQNHAKQQHYIPRKSYLDYFTDSSDRNPFCWVYYDKKTFLTDPGPALKKITPQNLCKESYFYESSDKELNALEKALCNIESNYKNVLENKILKKDFLSKEEKFIVSLFISSLESRTPASKLNIDNFVESILHQVTSLEKQFSNGKISDTHSQLLEMKTGNIPFSQLVDVSMVVNRWQFSDMIFLTIEQEFEDTFFITSDFPVCLYDFTLMNSPYGIPPLSSTLEVVAPLTPKTAVFINNIGLNGYLEVWPNFIREVNNRTMLRSNKHIVSPKELSKKFFDACLDRSRQSLLLLVLDDKLSNRYLENHSK